MELHRLSRACRFGSDASRDVARGVFEILAARNGGISIRPALSREGDEVVVICERGVKQIGEQPSRILAVRAAYLDGVPLRQIRAVLASALQFDGDLHRIDPEQYLDEILRVLPYWPQDRYLELAPNRWQVTRSKLRADELDAPLCSFTIPAP